MRVPTFGAIFCFRLKARRGHGVSLEACSLQDASIHDLNTLSLFATARKNIQFVFTARRVDFCEMNDEFMPSYYIMPSLNFESQLMGSSTFPALLSVI